MRKTATAVGRRPGEWTLAEAEVLGRSVLRAPSVHNTQPWRIELADGAVLLRERADVALPRHDPYRRDLAMSCGTALANLELAVRVLGRSAEIAVLPDPADPAVVARVDTAELLPPTDQELQRYGAIMVRRSHRGAFTGLPVTAEQTARVVQAAVTTGAEATRLDGMERLAKFFEHAARALRNDEAYQSELALWTIRDEAAHRNGAGMRFSALPPGEVPWAGLVRRATVLPDLRVLRERLEAETLLLFTTVGDARIDHIHAGYALERGWLEGVTLGLAGAVLTQPLRVPEVRSALCEDYRLAGFPQALLRLGRSTRVAPASLRRGVAEVLGEKWRERR
ncbi:Acg family FMN-binding oxidoreductase [Amycolatopsis silviterrae]|uniref:Acg family FMN-binding oxidoreductase n=1 Tax=Amycolatopsis silviterrae TaxID=1656914 RepID=A0ABW5H5X2_9PSEU